MKQNTIIIKKYNHRVHRVSQRKKQNSIYPSFVLLCVLRGFILLFFVGLLLLGCARKEQVDVVEEQAPEAVTAVAIEEAKEAVQETPEPAVREPRFAISPESAQPGEPVAVICRNDFDSFSRRDLQAVLLDQRGRRLTKAYFFNLPDEQEYKASIVAVPSTALIGRAVIRIEAGNDMVGEISFTIDNREFRSETIALNQANTDLRTVPDPQKTEEAEYLWAVISRTGDKVYSEGPFKAPVESTRRTSDYGSRRVYRYANGNTDTTIHFGVDIGVPTGTAVLACAPGRVVLARERIVTGNTVIVEHLPGVYSLYYHMDNIAVSEGSIVEEAAFLGESGSTGLATGPHLHWEIRVSGENADPDIFLSRPVLDKEGILAKLNSTER